MNIFEKYSFFIVGVLITMIILPRSIKAQDIKLNLAQVIGSHNSYKAGIHPSILEYLNKVNPTAAKSLQYEHLPYEEQLDMGLRNLEIDVFHDPEGGKYSRPRGIDIIQNAVSDTFLWYDNNSLHEPGLKVFHIQDIDFQSHHFLFKDVLKTLLVWSEANPEHHPIIILINAKDGAVPGTIDPLPFSAAALDSIDLEIKAILNENKLITPAMVQGSYGSLEQAVLSGNWPKIIQVKGRFLFVLDENEEKNERYLSNYPLLNGAVMFINVKEGNPNAGFRIINDPVQDHQYIKELVAKGYMVRTRADADTKEARFEDYNRFEMAKSSGAQVISTDYYVPSSLFPSSYKVSFEGNSFERVQHIDKNNQIPSD